MSGGWGASWLEGSAGSGQPSSTWFLVLHSSSCGQLRVLERGRGPARGTGPCQLSACVTFAGVPVASASHKAETDRKSVV